jgi:hypothetical protein
MIGKHLKEKNIHELSIHNLLSNIDFLLFFSEKQSFENNLFSHMKKNDTYLFLVIFFRYKMKKMYPIFLKDYFLF